jgi:uncharacterized protein DUF2785
MTFPLKLAVSGLLFSFTLLTAAEAWQARSTTSHSREFWLSIVKHNGAVPEGESVLGLARELSSLLGSPDPELRDDIAYSILDAWIVRQRRLSTSELLVLLDEWSANLRKGLGESGTDSVLKRSFSALCLASLAEYDLRSSFLDESHYRALLADALAYLKGERDLRGFDAAKGWIHSTAHTADLLKPLASNALFTKNDQQTVLAAISEKLSSAREVYTQGEQGRLAQTVVAIVKRSDFDGAAFDGWLAQLKEEDRATWSQKPLTPAALARYQNHTYTFEAIVARMSMESLSGAALTARDALVNVLKRR